MNIQLIVVGLIIFAIVLFALYRTILYLTKRASINLKSGVDAKGRKYSSKRYERDMQNIKLIKYVGMPLIIIIAIIFFGVQVMNMLNSFKNSFLAF